MVRKGPERGYKGAQGREVMSPNNLEKKCGPDSALEKMRFVYMVRKGRSCETRT